MARQNLVFNPSFRLSNTDTTVLPYVQRPVGWAPLNEASLAVISTTQISDAYYGAEYLEVTKSGLGGSGFETENKISITAGLDYAASAYVRVPVTVPATESAQITLKIRWLDTNQEYLSETFSELSTALITPNQDWTRLAAIGVAPTGAEYAEIYIYQIVPGTDGEVFHVDAVMLEQANYTAGYIDNLTQAEEDIYVNRSLSPRQLPTVGGMELNADITIGELVLNTIDESGVVWVCTDIEGWWGQAEPEIPDIPRGVEDGSYDVIGRYQSRQLTLRGVFLPQRTEQIQQARDQLISATNLVRRGAWLRTSEDPTSPYPTRASFVRLSGRPQIQTVNARGRTEFSIGLKAADPIKYGWNDADNQGLVYYNLTGEANTGTVTNYGTADVTAVFEITGPAGAGSTIFNSLTNETVTLAQPLRGSGAVGNITNVELFNGIATITTAEDHQLLVGDIVTISGPGEPFETVNTEVVVTASNRTAPYTFSYSIPNEEDQPKRISAGSVALVNNDVLIVDTYSRSVTFNGDNIGERSRVDTLTDWIKLAPGNNIITFTDSIDPNNVIYKSFDPDTAIASLTFEESHFLIAGQEVSVSLPTETELIAKSLTNNVVKLTTSEGHGFSIGDTIDVQTTEISDIAAKELTDNVVTLTTVTDGGFAVGDQVSVEMTTTKNILSKSSLSNTVTLKTADAHGYSTGDSVTVALPTASSVSGKALSANLATITTPAAHNYSVGDSVTVTLPTTATVTEKQTTGTTVVLTTNATHNFSINDRISIALPTSATLTGTRSFSGDATFDIDTAEATATTCYLTTTVNHGFAAGQQIMVTGLSSRYNGVFTITNVGPDSIEYQFAGTVEPVVTVASGIVVNVSLAYLFTVNTTASHGFSVGDSITVNTGITPTAAVTTREASTTTCTLTTSAAHNFSVGEQIVVAGVSSRYNGTFIITAVDAISNTVTYAFDGTSESSTSSSGSITNTTIAVGYNGIKVIETIPSATSFTYNYYGQNEPTSSTLLGMTPTVVNNTNSSLNGTVTITSVPATNKFAYTRVI